MNILDQLSTSLRVDRNELQRYIHTAPYRYRTYEIAKRSGKGSREIAQPAPEVKTLQRLAVAEIHEHFPVHYCAMAYEKGSSIRKNAEKHSKSRYLLKMDFRNFFPSVKPDHFKKVLERCEHQFTDEDIDVLVSLFFFMPRKRKDLRLSIGAPSSPFISNCVMYSFDEALSDTCERLRTTYTRYADDLTFTTNEAEVLYTIPKEVRTQLKVLRKQGECAPSINSTKTVFSSKKFNRHVTGLVLTNDDKVSLGRERKRMISAMVHKFDVAVLPEKDIPKLRGLLAFAQDAEPDFVERLARKYGRDVLDKIKA